ncbi:coiled-coil domain-containing protein 63-like [Agrilus planipennis]|uniref:Coiled-coil domain-containing protein 63-like n=1 Tax=Agrilus planipennis TaxID=224129 RepID=A0A1W4X7K1_AGRPL|nr:coiled-coil domain-containing protein 63-like [Agrilus planipennis]
MSIYKRMLACGKRGEYDDDEMLEVELDNEKDLNRLRREYKICDKEHWALLKGTDRNLAKMKKVIKIFKKEHKTVNLDLAVATCDPKREQDIENALKIKKLMRESNKLDEKIKQARSNNSGLEQQIRMTEKNIKKLRASRVTDLKHQKKIQQSNYQIERLEKKLETQNEKLGAITGENQKLREEIIDLINERNRFNTSWEKMISKLYKGKKVLMDLFQQCTVTYNARDECIQKLKFLRSRAYSDFNRDVDSQSALERNLDHRCKLSNFIRTKQIKRHTDDLKQTAQKTKRAHTIALQIKRTAYEHVLDAITELTHAKELPVVMQGFLKEDIANFSKFNLIVRLNDEIEETGNALRETQTNIEQLQAKHKNISKNHEQLLANLEERLKKSIEEADAAETKTREQDGKLRQIFEAIRNLFEKAECDDTPFLSLLSDNSTPNKYNVILYLEAVEQQFRKYILAAFYKQQSADVRKAQGTIIKAEKSLFENVQVDDYTSTSPCPLCVELEMVGDVVDTLQFSFTRTEVRKYLEERLEFPDGADRLHSVSQCNLPKSRDIVHKRYQ